MWYFGNLKSLNWDNKTQHYRVIFVDERSLCGFNLIFNTIRNCWVLKKKAIIVSGYFNPLHKGHIEYFNNAKALCDDLFVIVNNDYQRELKGSRAFQDEQERLLIVSNIKSVDKAILSIDQDRSVCESIRKITEQFGTLYDLVFANGGDQNNETIPEITVCKQLGVELIDGLGDKIQSSSWLLDNPK